MPTVPELRLPAVDVSACNEIVPSENIQHFNWNETCGLKIFILSLFSH